MTRQERYKTYLQLCTEVPDKKVANPNYLQICDASVVRQQPIYYQFAKVASGQRADDEEILRGCHIIHQRLDCSDFRMNLLVRMLFLYPNTPLVGAHVHQELHDLILDFDYWVGENTKFPGRQIIWTENHVMLYHVCEYTAAKLYPDETFRFRGKTGREIMADIRPKLIAWMDMKTRVGYSEWDSNCYAEDNFMSLLNLYDFSEDEELRTKAKKLMDIMTFSFAVNSYKGTYACSHGRTYTRMLLSRYDAPSTTFEKLLWGNEEITDKDVLLLFGCMALATSSYEPQPLIEAIAKDESMITEGKEQQSFDAEDAPLFGGGFETDDDMALFWHNMAYTHVKVIDKMQELSVRTGIHINPAVYPEYRYYQDCKAKGIEPETCRVRTYNPRVNLYTYRTPEYQLSCAQDFRKGGFGFQQHIWQATLADDAVVFTSNPGTLNCEDARPDFWAGNQFLPRALQHKDTLICLYNITKECPVPYSHAYFPQDKFDEVYTVANWAFGKKDDGYVALFSQNGFAWTKDGQWADKELVCTAKQNIWLCQMGRKEEYGSFLAFISAMLACKVDCDTLSIAYTTPQNQQICANWDDTFTLDGAAIQIHDYKRFDHPLCQSDYRSGKYTITYKGETLELSM